MPYSPPTGGGLLFRLYPELEYTAPNPIPAILEDLPEPPEHLAYSRQSVGLFTNSGLVAVTFRVQADQQLQAFRNLGSPKIRADFRQDGAAYIATSPHEFVFSEAGLPIRQLISPFTQVGTATVLVRGQATQTLQSIASTGGAWSNVRLATASQVIAAYAQTATGLNVRSINTNQVVPDFTQVAAFLRSRLVAGAQTLLAPTQVATIYRRLSATAARTVGAFTNATTIGEPAGATRYIQEIGSQDNLKLFLSADDGPNGMDISPYRRPILPRSVASGAIDTQYTPFMTEYPRQFGGVNTIGEFWDGDHMIDDISDFDLSANWTIEVHAEALVRLVFGAPALWTTGLPGGGYNQLIEMSETGANITGGINNDPWVSGAFTSHIADTSMYGGQPQIYHAQSVGRAGRYVLMRVGADIYFNSGLRWAQFSTVPSFWRTASGPRMRIQGDYNHLRIYQIAKYRLSAFMALALGSADLPQPPLVDPMFGVFRNSGLNRLAHTSDLGEITQVAVGLNFAPPARFITAGDNIRILPDFTNEADITCYSVMRANHTFGPVMHDYGPVLNRVTVLSGSPSVEHKFSTLNLLNKPSPVTPSTFGITVFPVSGPSKVLLMQVVARFHDGQVPSAPDTVIWGTQTWTMVFEQNPEGGLAHYSWWCCQDTQTAATRALTIAWSTKAVFSIALRVEIMHGVATHNNGAAAFVRQASFDDPQVTSGLKRPVYLEGPMAHPSNIGVIGGWFDSNVAFAKRTSVGVPLPRGAPFEGYNIPESTFGGIHRYNTTRSLHLCLHTDQTPPLINQVAHGSLGTTPDTDRGGAVQFEIMSVYGVPVLAQGGQTLQPIAQTATALVANTPSRVAFQGVEAAYTIPPPTVAVGLFKAIAKGTSTASIGLMANVGAANGCRQALVLPAFLVDQVAVAPLSASQNIVYGLDMSLYPGRLDPFYGWGTIQSSRAEPHYAVTDRYVGSHLMSPLGTYNPAAPTHLLHRFNTLDADTAPQGDPTAEAVPGWPMNLLTDFGRFKKTSFGVRPGQVRNRMRIRLFPDFGIFTNYQNLEVKFWLYLEGLDQQFWIRGFVEQSGFFDQVQFSIQRSAYYPEKLIAGTYGNPLDHRGHEAMAFMPGTGMRNIDPWNLRKDEFGTFFNPRRDGYRTINDLQLGQWNFVELQLVYRREGPTMWLNGQRDLQFRYPDAWFGPSSLNPGNRLDSEYSTTPEWIEIGFQTDGSTTAAIDELLILNPITGYGAEVGDQPTGFPSYTGQHFVSAATTTNRYLEQAKVPEYPFTILHDVEGQHIPAFAQVAEMDTGAIIAQFVHSVTLLPPTQVVVIVKSRLAEQDTTLAQVANSGTFKTSEEPLASQDIVLENVTQVVTIEKSRVLVQDATFGAFTQVATAENLGYVNFAESFKSLLMVTQVATVNRIVSLVQGGSIGVFTQTATAILATGFNHFPVLLAPSQSTTVLAQNLAVSTSSIGLVSQVAEGTSEQYPVRDAEQARTLQAFTQTAEVAVSLAAQAAQTLLQVAQQAVITTTRLAEAVQTIGVIVQFVPVTNLVKAVLAQPVAAPSQVATAELGGLAIRTLQANAGISGFSNTTAVGVRASGSSNTVLPDLYVAASTAKVIVQAQGLQSIAQVDQQAEFTMPLYDRAAAQDVQLQAFLQSQLAIALIRSNTVQQLQGFTSSTSGSSSITVNTVQDLQPPYNTSQIGDFKTFGVIYVIKRAA